MLLLFYTYTSKLETRSMFYNTFHRINHLSFKRTELYLLTVYFLVIITFELRKYLLIKSTL